MATDAETDLTERTPAGARRAARWRAIAGGHRGYPKPERHLGRFLRILGPGLITGAADDDPSGIGTYSQVGASYGVQPLWLALYLLPLVIGVQEMCGRIGLVTGKGIAGVVRAHYGRRILIGAVGLVVIANTINVGADLGAMAASAQLLAPAVPYPALLIGFTAVAALLEIFVPYRLYARLLKFLALSLLAYVATGVLIHPDWGRLALATLVPSVTLTPQYIVLATGVIGTTISPYLFFWQASEEVEEEKLHHRLQQGGHDPARKAQALRLKLRNLRVDTVFGLFASVATAWFIITTTGVILHGTHGAENIQSADQAARALKPLVQGFPHAGLIARTIFALGVIGTGLLAVPVLAGSAAYGVAEAFGWRQGLNQKPARARNFYAVIAVATLVGLALNFLGVNPIQALVYTAVINGVVAAPLLFLLLRIANDRAILGEHRNGWLSNLLGGVAAVAMTVAAVVTIGSLFFQ